MLSASTELLLLSSSEEDDKDDEEDDQDKKDLDHQPTVGGDRLEIFEDLSVGSLHVQLGVLNVGIDPVRGSSTGRIKRMIMLPNDRNYWNTKKVNHKKIK